MLVLKRYRRQFIVIGDPASEDAIVICLAGTDGSWASLAIDAPPEVPVHRLEVAASILNDSQRTFSARVSRIIEGFKK